jgi:holo-[acyl-carrier protein] synthase
MDGIATGVDLVEVERLAELKDSIRQKFIERVCTPLEIIWVDDMDVRLAVIFAVKEAVAKTLGCGIGDISWQDIEMRLDEHQHPELCLLGRAREISHQMGLDCWRMSTSHTDRYALAFVVAWSSA